jgi:hypothetical protein
MLIWQTMGASVIKFFFSVQSNLCTMVILGTQKMTVTQTGGCYSEVVTFKNCINFGKLYLFFARLLLFQY